MKKIESIIRHEKLEVAKNSLSEAGIQSITVMHNPGFDRQCGHKEMYRESEYRVDFLQKVKLEVGGENEDTSKAVDTMLQHTSTGQIGDETCFSPNFLKSFVYRRVETGAVRLRQRRLPAVTNPFSAQARSLTAQ